MIRLIQGNAMHLPLADQSVHCCVTSPPYWALRDYGIAGQLGLEKTPEEYVANMVAVFREVWRVLRDDGTLWLNIGDSYAHSGECGGGSPVDNRKAEYGRKGYASDACRGRATDRVAQSKTGGTLPAGLKPKDLVGIPWLLAFALRADGWYLRQDIIWHKPNPMPESVTDRCTKSHEYLFLLTKRPRYYYDAEAIREPHTATPRRCGPNALRGQVEIRPRGNCQNINEQSYHPSGRNRRDVWTISTQAFPEAHFATFPVKLVLPCIQAGTSERGVCPTCGAPWRRIVDKVRVATRPGTNTKIKVPGGWDTAKGAHGSFHREGRGAPEYRDTLEIGNRDPQRHVSRTTTTTWVPTCKCPHAEPIPATVLDPFAGAATTGVACLHLGRSFVGVEMKREYIDIATRRLQRESLPRKQRKPRRQRVTTEPTLFGRRQPCP